MVQRWHGLEGGRGREARRARVQLSVRVHLPFQLVSVSSRRDVVPVPGIRVSRGAEITRESTRQQTFPLPSLSSASFPREGSPFGEGGGGGGRGTGVQVRGVTIASFRLLGGLFLFGVRCMIVALGCVSCEAGLGWGRRPQESRLVFFVKV